MREVAIKEKIVAVASRLFYQQGYNLTGINQVIEEADIAKASLYHHFASKTDLLLAYLDQWQQNWYTSINAYLEAIDDPKEKLLALFDYRIQSQQRGGFGGCPFIKINDEISKEDKVVIERVQQNKDTFKKFINTLVRKSGHRKILSNEALTDMIYLMMEGGLTSASIYKDTKDLKSARNIVSQFL